jgi:hypothetical protein
MQPWAEGSISELQYGVIKQLSEGNCSRRCGSVSWLLLVGVLAGSLSATELGVGTEARITMDSYHMLVLLGSGIHFL